MLAGWTTLGRGLTAMLTPPAMRRSGRCAAAPLLGLPGVQLGVFGRPDRRLVDAMARMQTLSDSEALALARAAPNVIGGIEPTVKCREACRHA